MLRVCNLGKLENFIGLIIDSSSFWVLEFLQDGRFPYKVAH